MMKKFYVLENTYDEKNVGIYPQVKSFKGSYDKSAKDSVYRTKWNEIPNFEPNLGQLILHSRAKLTDFISTFLGGNALLLSSRVFDVFKEFHIPKHKIIPVQLLKGEDLLTNYYRFFYQSRAIDLLDLKQCEFVKSQRGRDEIFSVSSIEELRRINQNCLIQVFT